MNKKKNPGWKTLLALAAALMVMVNVCASGLTALLGLRFDVTGDQLYALSGVTLEALEGLETPVRLRVFSPEEDFLPLVAEVLRRYDLASGQVTVEYVDPYARPTLVDEYIQKGLDVRLNTVVAEGPRVSRAIQLEDMFTLSQDGSAVETLSCEPMLTGAILSAAAESLSVRFTSGHGERVSQGLTDLFARGQYETGYVTLAAEELPRETNLLVIASPTGDFSPEEIAALDGYLSGGGRMMAFMEPSSEKLPQLEGLLEEWGVGLTDTVVAEAAQYTDGNPLSIIPLYAAHEINQYFVNNQLYVVMPSARALEQRFVSQGGVRTQKLLYSTDRAYDSLTGETGLFTLAMTAEKEETGARVFAAGSRGLYSDSWLNSGAYGNSMFLAQVVNWCTNTESAAGIPPKVLGSAPISVTAGQQTVLAVLLAGVLPLSFLAGGCAVYYRRRHS